ncbi:MAG TPA: DUF1592 domain-containing protein [Polyangiaceae bacterium]|jgi:hypothetical protein
MRRTRSLVLAAALATAACVGHIGDGGLSGGGGLAGGGPGGTSSGGTGTLAATCGSSYAPGHVAIHRLTNDEYDNTIQDLLYTTATPGTQFDPSPAGQSGFSNDSDALIISDDLVAAYYNAGEALAKAVIATKGTTGGAYAKIVTCAPSASCAQSTIQAFATRAYRRPATADEVTTLMNVFNQDTDFDTGVQDVINAVLVNPKFIFESSTNPQSQVDGATFAIDDYALASRLSYAIWQTMPDDQLFQLAGAGQLHDPATLEAQVARMLKDTRVARMLTSMRNDWAGLLTLADPNGKLVGLDDGVRAAMVGEVDAFLQDLVANDRSFLQVLTGQQAFVNQTMATYYGVPFTGSDPNTYVPVSLPPDRTGLVTTAGILTATAGDVAYTHPVHRGHWLTQKITCTPPSLPPNNTNETFTNPSTSGETPRQALAQHTADPACAGCHQSMDALGLGLENYDPFGLWRTTYPDIPGTIDASGTLPPPSDEAFSNGLQMYSELAASDGTRACLAQQLMAYVLTRALSSTDDLCIVNQIGTTTVTPSGSFSSTMSLIAQSRQFLMQTGEAP